MTVCAVVVNKIFVVKIDCVLNGFPKISNIRNTLHKYLFNAIKRNCLH